MSAEVVHIEGLAELRRDFKAVDKKLDRKLTTKIKKAIKYVVDDAKERVPVGPDAGGHARDAIKSGVSGDKVFIVGGKRQLPYYGWLDFGGREAQGANTRSYLSRQSGWTSVKRGPWAGSGKGPDGGRFIYPAIEANGERIERDIRGAVDEALKENQL